MGGGIYDLLVLFCPLIHYWSFVLATSEEEEMESGDALWYKLLDNFFHQVVRGKSAFVGQQNGGDTYPRFGYVLCFPG